MSLVWSVCSRSFLHKLCKHNECDSLKGSSCQADDMSEEGDTHKAVVLGERPKVSC